MTTPCQKDFKASGREWTSDDPPRTRAELRQMTGMCRGCPIQPKCAEMAAQGLRDADGRWVGHVTGVWGGYLWRHGQRIDPWGDDRGIMRSVYRLVWYDSHRRTWRAETVVNGRRIYLAQTDNEDEAGAAAYGFQRGFEFGLAAGQGGQ